MSTEVAANQNVIMQLQIQPALPRTQLVRDEHITMIVMTALTLLALSFLLLMNCIIYGGYFWALLATFGPLSCVHAFFVMKYVSCLENSADERIWRWAISLLQLVIAAAYPTCMYNIKQAKEMHIAGWVAFSVYFLQTVLTSGVYLSKKDLGDVAVHPLPPEQLAEV